MRRPNLRRCRRTPCRGSRPPFWSVAGNVKMRRMVGCAQKRSAISGVRWRPGSRSVLLSRSVCSSRANFSSRSLPHLTDLTHLTHLTLVAARRTVFAVGVAAVCLAGTLPSPAAAPSGELDPAAWGSDHAGKALPEYITDDECLFCHRVKIGPAWPQNRHQSTIRNTDPEARTLLKSSKSHAPFAEMAEYVLGRTNQWRFLKRSGDYG